MWPGEQFDVEIAGSGDVKATGRLQTSKIRIGGSGDVDFTKLQVKDVDVRIAGSGDVRYGGDPKVATKIVGSGKVKKADPAQSPQENGKRRQ